MVEGHLCVSGLEHKFKIQVPTGFSLFHATLCVSTGCINQMEVLFTSKTVLVVIILFLISVQIVITEEKKADFKLSNVSVHLIKSIINSNRSLTAVLPVRSEYPAPSARSSCRRAVIISQAPDPLFFHSNIWGCLPPPARTCFHYLLRGQHTNCDNPSSWQHHGKSSIWWLNDCIEAMRDKSTVIIIIIIIYLFPSSVLFLPD